MSRRGGGVDEFCPFIFPDGKGVVAVFSAYFDESDRRDGNQPIVIGGLIFTPRQYNRFRTYWQSNVLRYRGRKFSAFHMTDLVSGRQEYEGLAIPDRIVILNHAVTAVERNATGGIAVHFSQAEFEQKAPAHWERVFGSIYTGACGMCLQVTGHWLRQWKHQMDVFYVFEEGHKFKGQADEFLTAFVQDADFRKACRYRQHIWEAKGEPGLQAADLTAWTVARAMAFEDEPKGTDVPRAIRPFLVPMKRFAECLGDRFKLYLFQGKRLDRFFEDMSKPGRWFKRRGSHPRGLR